MTDRDWVPNLLRTSTIPVGGWGLLTMTALLLPGGLVPEVATSGMEQVVALVVHFGLFFVLSLLAVARFGRSAQRIVVALCLVIGLSLELVQGIVPGRTVELADAAANALGAVLAPFWVRPANGD